jgi:hypothetical protein
MNCQRSDIEALFGAANVAKWADLDGDQDPQKISARIAAAIAAAGAYVEDRLRDGPYAIPLTPLDGSPCVTMVNMLAQWAGVWLYGARGVQDADPSPRGRHGVPADRLAWHRHDVETKIRQIHARVLRLPLVPATTVAQSPRPVHVPTQPVGRGTIWREHERYIDD